MFVSLKRLDADIDRWRAEGWVDAAGAEAIRADLRNRGPQFRVSEIFALIGATLLVLAIATFVAANWAGISRPVKLGILIATIWASYGVSFALFRAQLETAAHAALLLGCGAFGATVMLVGQMYHLSGAPTDALLVWWATALLGGALLRSKPLLMMAAGLILLWSEWIAWDVTWFSSEWPDVHWWFLPVWAALAAMIWRAEWRGGFHVVALGLGYWIFALSWRIDVLAPLLIGLAVFVAAVGLPTVFDGVRRGGARATAVYGFLLAAASALVWQFGDSDAPTPLFAGVTLAGCLGIVWYAAMVQHATLLWWAYGATTAQLLILFIFTIGSLGGTAALFGGAGLIAIIAAIAALRLTARAKEETSA